MGKINLIKEIKKKREISEIEDSFVESSLNKTLKEMRIKEIDSLSDKDVKQIVKSTRAKLRIYVGRFKTSKKHVSLEERKEFYEKLKEIIDELGIKSILDIGCGLNPIMIAEKNFKYCAIDINEEYIKIINKKFKESGIDGTALSKDVRKIDYSELPFYDLVLMMKILDLLESRGHKLAEKIITSLKCKFIIVSFSTKTLSGKPMNHPQRGWIERMLNRVGYSFSMFKFRNEIFYLIRK